MNAIRTLALLAALAPAVVLAQWQWIDKDGRKVFSDRAPPPDVPAAKILRRPGGAPAEPAAPVAAAPAPAASAAAPAASGASAARPAGPVPTVSGRDKALEDRRKQAAAAEAEKKKAEQEERAAAREENCKRARQGKATLDSGVRLTVTNDKGEREILDDKGRAAEVERINSIIARDCAPQ